MPPLEYHPSQKKLHILPMNSALMKNYGNPELEFERGQGCYLYTRSGDQYLDFAMGIAVNCLGHCHPVLINALTEQANKLWHTSNLYRIGQAEKMRQGKTLEGSTAEKARQFIEILKERSALK